MFSGGYRSTVGRGLAPAENKKFKYHKGFRYSGGSKPPPYDKVIINP